MIADTPGPMISIRYGPILPLCTMLVASLTPGAAIASDQIQRPALEEAQLAACIVRASAGRPWLEKTL